MGWEGLYSVSSLGRIKRHSRGRRLRTRSADRLLSVRFNPKRRYCAVHLYRNGKAVDRYVHCLVAEAFIGPKLPGKEVNHRNSDRRNNAASNLEYLTHAENIIHAIEYGDFDQFAFASTGKTRAAAS